MKINIERSSTSLGGFRFIGTALHEKKKLEKFFSHLKTLSMKIEFKIFRVVARRLSSLKKLINSLRVLTQS